MKLKFEEQGDKALIKTVEWMLGYDGSAPNNWRFSNWNKSRRRLASPISHYLREIERFSFDRGVNYDLPEVDHDDPRQVLIRETIARNFADELVYASFERGAVTGAVHWFFRPDSEKYYRLYLYDSSEVQPYPQDSGENGFMVQVKGARKWQRWGFTDKAYIEYRSTINPRSEWVEETVTPHPYQTIPGIQILNKVRSHDHKGIPSFDWASVEMAIEICAQLLGSAANYSYFGGPFIVSSDKQETLKELLSRSQVLSGRNDSDLQDTEVLKMEAMPTNHKDFMDGLARNFSDHLGISWVPDTPPGDTSSLTLRLLYSKTISAADKVSERYMGGFQALLEKILVAAAYDSVVVGVTPTRPETYTLERNFVQEMFPPTPLEKTQILGVVEMLQSLGVAPEIALGEYYTSHSTDQIRDIMLGA